MNDNSPDPSTIHCQGSVVSQGVLYSPDREPALLASMPAPAGVRLVKERLVAALREHPLAGGLQDLTLGSDRLGKPHLLAGAAPGPAVSFSWSAGAWWAALGTDRSWLGLDAATPGEFAGAYPLQRVFRPAEWQAATAQTGGNREEAAALLWSVKEAVAKAQGCGDHFFGPRQIRVEFAGLGAHGPCWRGHLEADTPERFSPGSFPAASVRRQRVWLTVAWLTPAPGETPILAG
jgi:phosphopantetheinyl transferase